MVSTRGMSEDEIWNVVDPEDLWAFDKLIISRLLGYVCGPVGLDVPKAGWYIVRPCVNMMGLGLGAQKVWLDDDTTHLPLGHFWCEWFEGQHISVDFTKDETLVVGGVRKTDDLTRWHSWVKLDIDIECPAYLKSMVEKYGVVNCEFIGNKLIEVHFRENPDFTYGNTEFLPIFEGEDVKIGKYVSKGYDWIHCPEYNGRIGAWVK